MLCTGLVGFWVGGPWDQGCGYLDLDLIPPRGTGPGWLLGGVGETAGPNRLVACLPPRGVLEGGPTLTYECGLVLRAPGG